MCKNLYAENSLQKAYINFGKDVKVDLPKDNILLIGGNIATIDFTKWLDVIKQLNELKEQVETNQIDRVNQHILIEAVLREFMKRVGKLINTDSKEPLLYFDLLEQLGSQETPQGFTKEEWNIVEKHIKDEEKKECEYPCICNVNNECHIPNIKLFRDFKCPKASSGEKEKGAKDCKAELTAEPIRRNPEVNELDQPDSKPEEPIIIRDDGTPNNPILRALFFVGDEECILDWRFRYKREYFEIVKREDLEYLIQLIDNNDLDYMDFTKRIKEEYQIE